jgi:hypothetical protein
MSNLQVIPILGQSAGPSIAANGHSVISAGGFRMKHSAHARAA